jgi:hypothetical protein
MGQTTRSIIVSVRDLSLFFLALLSYVILLGF